MGNDLKTIINEEINNILNENQLIMGIKDVAEMASRTGIDYNAILDQIQNAFKQTGDVGVVELFNDMMEVKIKNISRGKYMFDYSKDNVSWKRNKNNVNANKYKQYE